MPGSVLEARALLANKSDKQKSLPTILGVEG